MPFSSSECISWLAVKMVESVAIVALNVVTIIIYIKRQTLRKRSTYLVINLAVADMLVGGFTGVRDFHFLGGVYCNVWKYNVTGIWENILTGTQMLFLSTSLPGMAAISLEQMHATFCPFRHLVIKKWVYGVIIAVVWVLTTVVSTAMVLISLFGKGWSHSFYLWQSFNCLCLFVICVSYASIVVKMYCGAHPQHHGAASRERKLTVTLLITTLVSLLLYLPYVVIIFLHDTTDSYKNISDLERLRLINSLIALCYTNSLVNPILYAIRMPEFKSALVALFRCRPQQRQVVLPRHVISNVRVHPSMR